MNHDVAVAWNWEHDETFVADLERCFHGLGMTFRSVTPGNVEGIIEAAGAVRWGVLLDRAWESDPRFRRLNDLVAASGTRVVNPPELSLRMGNKAAVMRCSGRKESASPGSWTSCRTIIRRPGWLR